MVTRKRIDLYSICLAVYASFGSVFFFFVLRWVHLQDPKNFNLLYIDRWGCPHGLYFLVSAIAIFVSLLAVLSLEKKSYRTIAVLTSITIVTAQLLGCLGYGRPIISIFVLHFSLAGIVGISAGERCYIFQFSDAKYIDLEIEYKEHLKLFGDLLNNLTLITISGGAVITLAFFTYLDKIPLNPLEKPLWPWCIELMFFYLIFGVYALFLTRYYWNITYLKEQMMKMRKRPRTINFE